MKKFFLGVFVILGIMVTVVAGGVIYLYVRWPAEKVLHIVNDSLVKAYGLRVEVSSARIDWIRGVRLFSPRVVEARGKVLLEAQEMGAYYDIWALLQKQIKFSRLSIRGLYATVEDIQQVIKRFAITNSQKKSSPRFDFVIHQLVFLDSQIVYHQIPVNINVTWNLPSLGNHGSYNGSLVSMYGRAHFQGKGSRIRFQVEDMDAGRFFPAAKGILVKRVGGELYLQGSQWLVKGSGLSFLWQSNEITAPRYSVLYDTKNQSLLFSDTKVVYTTSEIEISNLFYHPRSQVLYGIIKSFSFRLKDIVERGEGLFSGGLTFRYEKGDLSQLEGEVVLKDIVYGPLRIEGKFSVQGLSLDGEAEIRLGKNTLFLRSSPLGRKGLSLALYASEVDIGDSFRQKWPERSRASTQVSEKERKGFSVKDILSFLPLTVDVSIPKLVYDKLEINNLRFSLIPRGEAWIAENMGFDFLRGNVRGRAIVAGDFLRGSLQIVDVKIHDLNEVLLPEGKALYGTLRGTIEYQLPLTNLLSGYVFFSLTVNKPEFRGLVLQNQISEVLYNLPLERLSFDSLILSGEIREKELFVRDFSLNSYDIRVTAPTKVFFPKKGVDALVTLSVSRDYVIGLPNITQLLAAGYTEGNMLVFRLKVSNTWEKPKITLLSPER